MVHQCFDFIKFADKFDLAEAGSTVYKPPKPLANESGVQLSKSAISNMPRTFSIEAILRWNFLEKVI